MEDILKSQESELNSNMEITNKLLLEMVRNQKINSTNLVKIFIITIICYTVLLLSMVFGYFYYESQFETFQTVTTQEADTNGGNAIINSGGDVNYGKGEISDDNP